MPLDSLQRFCAGVAQATVLPEQIPGILNVRITPPPREKVTGPFVYVWGGRKRETRQTAPRGQGFKRLLWSVDVWLVYMDDAKDAQENEPFAKFTDAVEAAFRAAPMNIFIDSAGNVLAGAEEADASCSQILSVGEDMDLDYPPERTTSGQRMYWYQAHLAVTVLEVLQG